MSLDKKPQILIVDDDPQIRQVLRYAISARGYATMLAATAEEALERAAARSPDMVILDLSLPGMSGLEACKEIRTWSDVPILILSVQNRESDKITALDFGADDYLTKPFHTGELLARIRAHLRRGRSKEDAAPVLQYGDLILDLLHRQVRLGEMEIHLTKTEFALLSHLMRYAGRVLTHKMLLGTVWETEYEGDIQTLRVHMGNLRRKLEPDPHRPQFIVTEPGIGYRFQDQA